MKHIYCDVCKKEVEDPIPNRTFFHLAHVDFCESCRDDLEAAIKYTVRAREPFDLKWYDEFRLKLVEQGVQRGKIEVKRTR